MAPPAFKAAGTHVSQVSNGSLATPFPAGNTTGDFSLQLLMGAHPDALAPSDSVIFDIVGRNDAVAFWFYWLDLGFWVTDIDSVISANTPAREISCGRVFTFTGVGGIGNVMYTSGFMSGTAFTVPVAPIPVADTLVVAVGWAEGQSISSWASSGLSSVTERFDSAASSLSSFGATGVATAPNPSPSAFTGTLSGSGLCQGLSFQLFPTGVTGGGGKKRPFGSDVIRGMG